MTMNVETRIRLDKFVPRPYQLPIIDAIENKGYKRVLAIMPRRAGKDVVAFNLMIRAALKKVGVYYYIFPTYSQGKKVIYDSITNAGEKFIDYIPQELVAGRNASELKITLVNDSIIQIVGSDNIDSLMGSNPQGVVYSEWALQNEIAWTMIKPILIANNGWALFISTPRGKNHMYTMYEMALHSPDWHVLKLSVEDTQHISLADIEKERQEGTMSDDLIQQEFYCSFTIGIEGSFYARYIDRMRLKGQIGNTPWESAFPVYTCWDIGVRDSTCIIFFQIIGMTIRIIDCYEKSKEGLEHYAKVLNSKPYQYGKHIAPHDIAVKEWGSGMTRIEKAKQLGITFITADNISIEDGIESVRSALSKVWIDEVACAPLIKALENYRQEYDATKKVYKTSPLHDWSSHFADAMRYLCISLAKTRDSLSADELDRRYREAMYSDGNYNLPGPFR
jgi:phage terminase large subunit